MPSCRSARARRSGCTSAASDRGEVGSWARRNLWTASVLLHRIVSVLTVCGVDGSDMAWKWSAGPGARVGTADLVPTRGTRVATLPLAWAGKLSEPRASTAEVADEPEQHHPR